MITQKELKEKLHYDPEAGIFTWITSSRRAKSGDIAGHIDSTGYVTIRINKVLYGAHRLAYLYMKGAHPKNQIDHSDHDRKNNSWVNLSEATPLENQRNQSISKNNTSGFTGVYWYKNYNKWHARIMVTGNNKNLGYFENLEDAISARKAANIKYGFHENHGK